MTRATATDLQRFWSKVDKGGPVPPHRLELGPCWLWIAGHSAYNKAHPENNVRAREAARQQRLAA